MKLKLDLMSGLWLMVILAWLISALVLRDNVRRSFPDYLSEESLGRLVVLKIGLGTPNISNMVTESK